MIDHDGLRGIAALWIVVFHSCYYSRLNNINFQGSTLMPLFFLLSGFSMTIGYHDRLFSHSLRSSPNCRGANGSEGNVLIEMKTGNDAAMEEEKNNQTTPQLSPIGKYFYNRIIRVIPVYFICTCEAIPPTLYGYGNLDPKDSFSMISSFVQSFIPTSTWTLFLAGIPLDGPGWTIATLYFFWLCFPWLLKHYMQKSDDELLTSIVRCFFTQLLIIVILFPLLLIIGYESLAFWVPTAFPPCRLPVFIMGMNAGLLCVRHAGSEKIPWFSQSGTFIPWHFWYWGGCTCCSGGHKPVNAVDAEAGSTHCPSPIVQISYDVNFNQTCFQQAIKLLCITLLWTILTATIGDISSNAWFQGLNVFAQLDLIVGLARVGGRSLCSKVLRHPVVLWYGELSMALYLVHEPLIYYFCWFQNGLRTLNWPANQTCDTNDSQCQDELNHFTHLRRMEPWGIAIILPIATVLACLLYYGVEEPIRKNFK